MPEFKVVKVQNRGHFCEVHIFDLAGESERWLHNRQYGFSPPSCVVVIESCAICLQKLVFIFPSHGQLDFPFRYTIWHGPSTLNDGTKMSSTGARADTPATYGTIRL